MTITQYGLHEKLVNGYSDGELDGAINDSVTSLTLVDASGLPSAGYFRLKINDEIMVCDSTSGNDVSIVERGAEGTTAAAHSNGDTVEAVITNEALQQYLLRNNDNCAAYTRESTFIDSQTWPVPLGRALDENNADLTASDFTWWNQSTATFEDSPGGGFVMTIPKESSFKLRGVTIPRPTPPYSFTARIRMIVAPDTPTGTGTSFGGLWIRDVTGRLLVLALRPFDSISMWKWNSYTSYSGITDVGWDSLDYPHVWMRLTDDNTDIRGFFSVDGSHWTQNDSVWYSDSRTLFLSSGGNGIGFFMNSAGAGNSGSGPAVGTMAIDNLRVEEL